MANINVLASSNWSTALASGIGSGYSLGGCGWTGSAWHSEGKVSFTTSLVDTGIRVQSIDFTLSGSNPGYAPWAGVPSPTMQVLVTGSVSVYSGNVTGLSNVALTAYDETVKHITSIVFKSYSGWDSYWYGNDGDGGPTGPCHFLDVQALSFNTPDSPYLWQDYVNTNEMIL